MVALQFYCTPAEFWQRLRDAKTKFDLVCFVKNQRTGIVRQLSDEELDEKFVAVWQDDIWMAKILPGNSKDLIPAKEGWILFDPPDFKEQEKTIEEASMGAQVDWVEYGKIWKNEELARLLSSVRRLFCKNTKTGDVNVIFSPTSSRIFKCRYTPGAVEAQKNGWTFHQMKSKQILPEEY